MVYSLQDVQYLAADLDEDGRDESLMLIFPDQTLLCVSDNDGDGLADYAAVDINLTKIVDFAANRDGDVIEVQQRDAEGVVDYEHFEDEGFDETFPGWARLLAMRFPGGVPDMAALDQTLAVVNKLLLPEWTHCHTPWKEGALYRVPSDDGSYSVVKILEVDAVGVHIRRYSNRFEEPPEHVDESQLFLASSDAGTSRGFGIGHLPISARSFRTWSAEFVQQSTVKPDELTGYESWLEAEGGYF